MAPKRDDYVRRGRVLAVVLLCATVTGCRSGSNHAASTSSTSRPAATTPTSTGTRPALCRDAADCHRLLEHGGATATEADCLTPLMQQPVLPSGKDQSWAAAVKCVDSVQRLTAIIVRSSQWAVDQIAPPTSSPQDVENSGDE